MPVAAQYGFDCKDVVVRLCLYGGAYAWMRDCMAVWLNGSVIVWLCGCMDLWLYGCGPMAV